jgi:hypothetical protein
MNTTAAIIAFCVGLAVGAMAYHVSGGSKYALQSNGSIVRINTRTGQAWTLNSDAKWAEIQESGEAFKR